MRVAARQNRGFIDLHSIAEVYAALTRLPGRPRIHPIEAARIVAENILPHFEVVALCKEDYLEALSRMAGQDTILPFFALRKHRSGNIEARLIFFLRLGRG